MGIKLSTAPAEFLAKLPPSVAAMAEPKTEEELQDSIARWLTREGIQFTRSRMDMPTTNRPGTADFICCVERFYLAIECKMPGKTPSVEQKKELASVARNGGEVLVAYDLASVQKVVLKLQARARFIEEIVKRNGLNLKYI